MLGPPWRPAPLSRPSAFLPQDDPLLKELYASFSQDQARMEALHDVCKKRLRDAKQKEGKT